MSKKFISYLFIIISSIVCSANAFAGTDIINSTLEKVSNGIKTVSGTYEEISQRVRDITSGKILDDLGVTQAIDDFNSSVDAFKDAVDRTKYIAEKAKRIAEADSFEALANEIDAEHYNKINDASNAVISRSREILEERGLRGKSDDNDADSQTNNSNTAQRNDDNEEGEYEYGDEPEDFDDPSGLSNDDRNIERQEKSLTTNTQKTSSAANNQTSIQKQNIEDMTPVSPTRKGFTDVSEQTKLPSISDETADSEMSSKITSENTSKIEQAVNVNQSQTRRKFETLESSAAKEAEEENVKKL